MNALSKPLRYVRKNPVLALAAAGAAIGLYFLGPTLVNKARSAYQEYQFKKEAAKAPAK